MRARIAILTVLVAVTAAAMKLNGVIIALHAQQNPIEQVPDEELEKIEFNCRLDRSQIICSGHNGSDWTVVDIKVIIIVENKKTKQVRLRREYWIYGKMEPYSDGIFVKNTVGIDPSKREQCKFFITAVLGQRS